MRARPRIGITTGDPGGIGPEVLLKALQKQKQRDQLVLFGSLRVLLHHSSLLGIPFDPVCWTIVDIDNVPRPYFGPRPAVAGGASLEYLDAAFESLKDGKIHALVTGPIHKESWHRSGGMGSKYPGQTEYCAKKAGVTDFCMLMVGKTFRIAILSTHTSLRNALRRVKKARIIRTGRLLDKELRQLGIEQPRIVCAALNPHAGESGAFGTEELSEIQPAVRELQEQGIFVEGPVAPEVIYREFARERKWDVLLSMYHDQAMIPLKLVDFRRSANVTLGLPFIRTSPDHGTAFDIAGKGCADPGSMRYAIQLAEEWTLKRWKHDSKGRRG